MSSLSYFVVWNICSKKKNEYIHYLCFLFLYVRSWSVLNQIPGGGKCWARGGGEDSGSAARWRKLGSQWFGADVALRKQPLAHHHCQIRPVPGFQLPGEPAGRHFPSWQTHVHTCRQMVCLAYTSLCCNFHSDGISLSNVFCIMVQW